MKNRSGFVWSHFVSHPFAFLGIVFAGFINSIISFLLPVSVGEFFSIHYHSGGSKAKLLMVLGIHVQTIDSFLALFSILLLLKPVINYVESLGIAWHGETFVRKLRESVFCSQMTWEPASFERGRYSKYLLRYSNDMKAIQNYLTRAILGGIKNVLFILIGFVVLSSINLRMTVILASLVLCSALVISYAAHYQKQFIRTSRSKRSSMLAYVARKFSSFARVKRDQKEEGAVQGFKTRSEELFYANMQYNKTESFIQSGSGFLVFLMIGVLLWQITSTNVSSANSVVFILVILMMRSAFMHVLKLPGYLNKGKISLQKIKKLLKPSPVTLDQ